MPFDITAVMFDEAPERSLVAQEEHEELPFENLARTVSSLADHLDEQLRFATEDPVVRRIGNEIIGNLDEDGYLRAEVDEIARRCGVTAGDVEKVLALVQSFDPPGVAARSVPECLLLQLRADPAPDPLAIEIVEEHFDALSKRRYPDIARALKRPLDRVMEAIEEIMALEPKPGRSFGTSDTRYIAPDVIVQKVGDEYTVVLNEEGIPRLRVNALYRSLLRSSGDDAKQYVEQKLRSAMWLIKSVDQRQRTLRKVTSVHREVPAGVPRPGHRPPAAPRPARRGRGHRHARVHHQPRHHQQVRGDAPGAVRAEVLLPQRHRLRRRGDGVLGLGEEDDPGSSGHRGAPTSPARTRRSRSTSRAGA